MAEDNQINQLIASNMLESAGHKVDVVSNGVEAVQAIETDAYDLVLMDIFMPEMDGINATRKIREIPGAVSKIPIIALTANAMAGERDKCLAAGMNEVVSKPFDIEHLVERMKHCIGDGNSTMAAVDETSARAEPANNNQDRALDRPAAVDDTTILDQAVLAKLSDAVGEEMMPDLVGQSVDDMRDNLARIVELGNAADLDALQREAHVLKSTSGGFGAVRLQRLGQALDFACKGDREHVARRLVKEIEAAAHEAFEALETKYVARST